MDLTAQQDYQYSSVLDLHKTQDADILISSHNSVVEFHAANMETRELCHDYLAGDPWTPEEREVARQKKKPLSEFNPLKTSERTFVGSMIQKRYDVKPAPREPADQNKSDVYTAMYYWTADVTETRYKDPNLVRSAWAGGNAWQESFVEVTPGKKPRIIIENQNNFGIYPDPNRRDLVNNSDCEFIDRVSWMSRSQLCDAIPDKEDEILTSLPDPYETKYDKTKVYADRTHEWENYRNGKYKVVERFYKVRQKMWFGVSPQGEKTHIGTDVDQKTREGYKEDYPDHTMHMERLELLFLAIVCPAMGNVFLYNGEYHCQPRDPVTTRIMFPLVELVDEELDGQTSGHVFHQISPIKLINSLLTNKIFAAKNASAQSHVGSADHFDETTRTDIEENHNDGSRTFWKKPGAPEGSGMTLIEQGKSSPDGDWVLEYAANFQEKVSSTPPSMMGFSEGNVAGVLNDQRIQQADIQTQGFTNNYMGFLTRRAKLWKYYWKEYWKGEDVIRILEKKDEKDPDWIKINEIVQDEFGNVQTKNSLDDGDAYDITFEDSWKSPTSRDKIRKQLSEIMQSPVVQNDPEMSAESYAYFLQLSDAPQDFKSRIKEIADGKKKAAEAAAQAGPQPDPLRLSMSIKSEDLHDPNTIGLLEHSRVIPPELAQQMRQVGPAAPEADPSIAVDHQNALAENQALKLDAANKSQEMGLKATELDLKAQESAETLRLKAQELELKHREMDLKQAEGATAAMTAAQTPVPVVDPQITIAQIKAETEIEKAHISAAAGIHQTNLTLENSEEAKQVKETSKAFEEKTKEQEEALSEIAKAQKALTKTVEEIASQSQEVTQTITKLQQAWATPKSITINRDADGKIIGAEASLQAEGDS